MAYCAVTAPACYKRYMNASPHVALGCFHAALAIGAGAFGAHGLKDRLDARGLEIFETAAKYHMYHALGLVLAGLMLARVPSAAPAAWLMHGGIALFCGSLYLMALTPLKLGPVTPIGGVLFLASWLWLGIAWLRS